VSEQQKAADPGAASAGAEAKPEQGAEAKPKVYGEDYVKTVRDEAKGNREKAEKFEADLKAAQLELAKAKGDVDAIRKLEQEQRTAEIAAREAKIAELSPLAQKASAYEATLKAEAEARLASLPEAQRAFAATLPIEQQLAYARIHSTAQAAPPPARTPGAPGGTQPIKTYDQMDAAERRAALAGKSPAEIRQIVGIQPPKGLFSPA